MDQTSIDHHEKDKEFLDVVDEDPFHSGAIPLDVQFATKLFEIDRNLQESSGFELIPIDYLEQLSIMCYDYVVYRRMSRLRYIQLKSRIVDQHWQMNEQIRSLNLTPMDFDRIFSSLLIICQSIRQNKQNYHQKLSNQLMNSIRKHYRMTDKVLRVLFSKFYKTFESEISKKNLILPPLMVATGNRLISIRWELNLSISDRFLSKIMEPYIRFELIYLQGDQENKITFQCRIKQFHQLRFTVAWLLNEINRLEKMNNNKFLSSTKSIA